jgi:hypothetical protein
MNGLQCRLMPKNEFYYLYTKQKFVGRIIRLLSFDMTRTAQKMKKLGWGTQTDRKVIS